MPPELRQLTYAERLRKLEHPSLAERRTQRDLVETYKITTGSYSIPDLANMFQFAPKLYLRGHQRKLRVGRWARPPRKHFLSNRTVYDWNQLPEGTVLAPENYYSELVKFNKKHCGNSFDKYIE